MSGRIHLSKAHIGDLEEKYVLAALRSGWVAPLGPDVDAFEAEVAARVGVSHALALSSGTAALHLALLGVGAGPGTVVVVPSLTFAASANAVLYTGATPVFVDSGADGQINPALALEAVDELHVEGHTVAAVMTVDLFGAVADHETLEAPLRARGVPMIEDAAEALGASRGGRAAGSFGAAAALSFNGNKIMTTSGGGMLVSDDTALVERARYLSTQARQPVPWYEHTEMGYNYRLSNILAALGRAQLERLDEMIARRRDIRQRYREAVASVPGVRLLADAHDSTPAAAGTSGSTAGGSTGDNCWLTCLTLDPTVTGVDPGRVIAALETHSIEARHLWKPMHLQPQFAGSRRVTDGTAQRLFETGVALPSGSALTDAEVDRVVEALLAALQEAP